MANIKKRCKSGHRSHNSHNLSALYEKYSRQGYTCNGCKMSGQGLTYRCETCDYDLHEECMFSQPMISPEIFEQCYEFNFFKLPPPGKHKSCKEKKYCLKCRNCDVCGMPVKGYVYHCKETDADLHPRCALLKKEIIVQSDLDHQLHFKFVLKEGIMLSKNCNACQSAELRGADKKIPGWCYVSEDHGEFSFHVYCIMQMCKISTAKAKNGAGDGAGGGGIRGGGIRGGSGGLAKIIEKPKVELQKKEREVNTKKKGGGYRRSKFYLKIFKSVLAAVVSILIGDPTTIIANVVVQLFTN